jgi:UDPglucose 6-dehydrogenase
MNLGVIGKGTVGSAVYDGLQQLDHRMCFFDPAVATSRFEHVLDTECVFICVPTDQNAGGDCDVGIVESVIKQLSQHNYSGLVAIKSTVIPGTTDRLGQQYKNLKICNVPEFLRARFALEDFVDQDVLVIGSTRGEDYELVAEIHGHYPRQISCVTPAESEIIKYFNNVNHSVQIIFANVMFEICKKFDADYQNVYDTIVQRDCFNSAYLDCNDQMRGFGGHCLPKDTSALANLIDRLGLNYDLIRATIADNQKLSK